MIPLLGLPLLCTFFLAALLGRGSSLGSVYPAVHGDGGSNTTSLYVGLIQSYDPTKPDDQLGSVGTVVGAELAVEHINANETILQGYTLHYNFINSQCNGYQAAAATFQQVLNPPTKIGIIGAGCSPSTQNAALVSQFYNLTQISCIATSPTLAQRDVYRRYIQLLPPEFETAEGFYSIISHYGWKKVGVILQEADLFEKTFIVLRDRLTRDGVDVQSYKLHFEDLQYYKEDVFDFDNFIGIRIFIIISYEAFTIPMLCEAYKRELWYPRYHFLLMGWYSHEWWKADVKLSDCSVEQIEQALQHSLSVDILPDARVLGEDWEAVDLGITNGEFYGSEEEHIANPPAPLHLKVTDYLSQYCYDATWAFAFALNQTISDLATNDTLNEMAREAAGDNMTNSLERFRIENFDYRNDVIVDLMMANWEKVSFVGVTGRVSFRNGLRELLRIRITQFLEDGGKFDEINIGHLENRDNFSISTIEDDIVWTHGEPHDGIVNETVDPVYIGVTAIFTILGLLGIGFAIVCLLLNFFLREKLIIKLSSPKLNYLIGVGAIFLYINIMLVVVQIEEDGADLATSLCCITPWFTAIGYSLCYGTILVKMFRTWYIFNNPIANKKKFQDWKLIMIVMCLVVLDVVIMTVYTVLEATRGGGASRVVNRELEKTISGPQEVVTLHYVYVCNSMERQATLGVLYGYKALFQISALFLSFATWKVQIRGLDDSKPIIIATYVTSLVLAVVIVSTYTLNEYINAYAAVFDVGFFLGTTAILCLVFMTKIYSLIKDPNGKNVFVSKSGDVREYRSSSSKMESQNEAMSGLKQINGEQLELQCMAENGAKHFSADDERSDRKNSKGVQFKDQ